MAVLLHVFPPGTAPAAPILPADDTPVDDAARIDRARDLANENLTHIASRPIRGREWTRPIDAAGVIERYLTAADIPAGYARAAAARITESADDETVGRLAEQMIDSSAFLRASLVVTAMQAMILRSPRKLDEEIAEQRAFDAWYAARAEGTR